MRTSEIMEFIAVNYPECCMVSNGCVEFGCRDSDYERDLVEPLMEFFSHECIGLCECGEPESTNLIIRSVLTIIKERKDLKLNWVQMTQKYHNELSLDMGSEVHCGLLQFVLYILDDKGILTHGGNIWGSSLTELGEMYLTVLNSWYEDEYSEED